MVRHKLVVLLAAGVFVSGSVAAETVSIPCEEFVQVTGKRLACDKMPVIKMPAGKWEKEKAGAKARSSADADVSPWDRKEAPQARKADKVIGGCDLPPWDRPEGLKCN